MTKFGFFISKQPKQIVWRCISRLEYGKQSCPLSPSISEEKLHTAILQAIRAKAAEYVDDATAQLNATLQAVQCGKTENVALQTKLEQAQRELAILLGDPIDTVKYHI